MRFPEVDFQSAEIGEITDLFFGNGCILLRNFADPARMRALQGTLHGVYDELGHTHVYEQDMLVRQHASLSASIFTDKHNALLKAIFGKHDYAVSFPTTCARRVSAANAKENWQKPLGFHLDAGFHTLSFTVNFWVPFQPCGVDAPSLAVVKSSMDEMLEYSTFDGKPEDNRGAGEWLFHHFNPLIFAAANDRPEAKQEIFDHFGERVWAPAYQLGDAMLISNFTLHGTHSTPEMKQSRESMELRFSTNVPVHDVLAQHKPSLTA